MSSVEHLGSLAKAVLEALKDHTEAGVLATMSGSALQISLGLT